MPTDAELKASSDKVTSLLKQLQQQAGPRGYTYAGRVSPTDPRQALKQMPQEGIEDLSIPMIGMAVSQFRKTIDQMFEDHLINAKRLGLPLMSKEAFEAEVMKQLQAAGKFTKLPAQEIEQATITRQPTNPLTRRQVEDLASGEFGWSKLGQPIGVPLKTK